MNKILIASDTYEQVNGVSTTYKNILKVANQDITIIHPAQFNYTSFKAYPEIQICYQFLKIYKKIKAEKPTHIHIATEGPVGLTARIYCKFNKIPFTSAYHTRFPEYIESYFGNFKNIAYFYLRSFHRNSKKIFVPSQSCLDDLKIRKFKNLKLWTRGVSEDLRINKPFKTSSGKKIKVLYVGRVSKEKNLTKLCDLENKFDITIVGDGPQREYLEKRYKKIKFVGYKFGKDLALFYFKSDVFCFPSKTDTFGVVIIEALTNGLPVAAYRVTGPKDIIEEERDGYLGNNLEENIIKCLKLNRNLIRDAARTKWSWKVCNDILISGLLN